MFEEPTNFLFFLPPILFVVIFITVIVSIVKSSKKAKESYERRVNKIQMTQGANIEKYYQMLIGDPELVKRRKQSIHNGKIIGIGLLLLFASFFTGLFFIGIPIFIICIVYTAKHGNAYSSYYKQHIIGAALKDYDDNLSYFPTEGISSQEYNYAHFESYDRYHSEDLIKGDLDGLPFVISDVHTEDRREDSDGDTYYVTLFHGPVAILTLEKPTNIQVSIIDNTIHLGTGDTYLEIDNPEFEEYYDVYTDDKVKAMRFLTPSVTNKILDLRKSYDLHFEIKLLDQLVYFRFEIGELFVPNASDTRKEAMDIALYFEILNGIKDVMKEINNSIEFLKK